MIDFSPLTTGSKPKKDIIELYPFLEEIQAVADFDIEYEGDDRDKMLHYMLLAYHPDSPMIKKYTSVSQRKERSIYYSGWNLSRDIEARKVENLIDLSDETFLSLVHGFLTHINNRTWAMIVLNETTFTEYQKQLLTPLLAAGDKNALQAAALKETLLKQIDEIDKRLIGYYDRLYMGDNVLVKEGTKRKGVSPEMIASNVHKA